MFADQCLYMKKTKLNISGLILHDSLHNKKRSLGSVFFKSF